VYQVLLVKREDGADKGRNEDEAPWQLRLVLLGVHMQKVGRIRGIGNPKCLSRSVSYRTPWILSLQNSNTEKDSMDSFPAEHTEVHGFLDAELH
jgi:hypothetical protein